jgi:MFS family permease
LQQQGRGDQEADGVDNAAEKPKVDRNTLRKDIVKPPFMLLCGGLFLAYLGFFSPLFYVSTYATYLGMSQRLAFYLVSMVNGASLFGRIIPGFIADRFGKFNLLILSCFSGA